MQTHQLYTLVGSGLWLFFAFAFGACAGSFTNVLVYRLPRGMSVVRPPSRCPACGTRLTWRENFPVLGWLRLGGRCRFCRSKISPEYPLVEAFVGLCFAALFALWYLVPPDAQWLGVAWGQIRPEWAAADAWIGWPRETWPEFIVLLVLVASLVAMTLVDAKTFTIPLEIPWFATVVGVLFHTGHAVYLSAIGQSSLARAAPGWVWAIPTPVGPGPATATGWWWIGASIGAMVGLGVGLLLVWTGFIRRSFADYQEWEAAQRAASPGATPAASAPSTLTSTDTAPTAAAPTSADPIGPAPVGPDASAGPVLRFLVVLILAGAILVAVGTLAAGPLGLPRWSGLAAACAAAPLFASATARGRRAETTGAPAEDPTEMWILYPHARREMIKELAFLAPCVGLGWLGGWLLGGSAGAPPLWLNVLAGTLMGYLIGGGVVWAFRIAGSLAFGKEAMGLGDVHLMAAVGACTGWIDAALAFPLAAVVGLYWFFVGLVSRGAASRQLPFGPYLAVATVLVILSKPLIEAWLTHLLAIPPGEPPVNLP